MKKFLAIIFVLLFTISLIGCNESKVFGGKTLKGTPAVSESSNIEDTTSEDRNEIVHQIVSEAQSQIESMESLLEGMLTISIEARGNSIAYVYTYTSDVGDINLVSASIEQEMESQKSAFKDIAEMMRTQGVANASVILEYFNVDGTLIYSIEIK